MKKLSLLLLSAFLHQNTFAQEATPTVIEMPGSDFCNQFETIASKTCLENLGKTSIVNLNLNPQNIKSQRKWTLRLYFGNGNTSYDAVDMRVKTSRLDLTMSNVKGVQRSGYDYFKVWELPLKNSLQWIDEPTNSLKIVVDKNNHQYYLMINHPKVVYINGHANPGLNNGGSVHVTGTVDGHYHDANMPLNPQFDGYNTQPGELNIVNFENSWMFMQTEVGYGYAIPLLQTKKAGSIVFTPQIGAGVYSGYKKSAIMPVGAYWDPQPYNDEVTRIMGWSITPAARLEWRSKKEYFGIFAEARRSYGKMNYPFLDGTIDHKMKYSSITLGISTAIGNDQFKFLKRKKK